jgi:hypothetical protein
MTHAKNLAMPMLLTLLCLFWAVPDAHAYIYGVTNLDYNGSLYGYSYTSRDYGDDYIDDSECYGGAESCYVRYYALWVSAEAALLRPGGALVTSDYNADQYFAWASVGAEADQYGVWWQSGDHRLNANVSQAYCTWDGELYCDDWWLLGPTELDWGNSDDSVDVPEPPPPPPPPPPAPPELSDISWSTQHVWVTEEEDGCYHLVWNPLAVDFIDFEVEVEGGAAGGTVTNWIRADQSCVHFYDSPSWFGTWRIKWARASNGTQPLEFGANGPAIVIHPPPPQLAETLTPSGAIRGTSGSLTIEGNYLSGATLESCSTSRVVISGVSASSNAITANYTVLSNAATGACALTVTTLGGDEDIDFVVADPTPSISSISPSSAEAGSTVAVTVSGTGFGSNPTLSVTPSGIYVTLGDRSDEHVNATFDLSNVEQGTFSVKVTSGGYGGNNFTPVPQGGTSQNSNSASFTATARPAVEIRFTSNGAFVPPNGFTTEISKTPTMPELKVSIVRVGSGPSLVGDVRWRVGIFYSAHEFLNYGEPNQQTCASAAKGLRLPPAWDGVNNGSETWISQSVTIPLDITAALNGAFVGGTLTVTAIYEGGSPQTHLESYKIVALNPDAVQVKARPPQNPSGSPLFSPLPWFFWKIVSHESTFKQFHTSGSLNGLPTYGFPDGWGLMKIDRSPQNTGCTLSTPDSTELPVLWNWKANIDAGGAILKQKESGIQAYLTDEIDKFKAYYISISTALPDVTKSTGGCTFSLSNTGGTVNPGDHPFYDAIWIKRYNGTPVDQQYIRWKNTNLGGADPHWIYHETTAYGNYVQKVCLAAVPQ